MLRQFCKQVVSRKQLQGLQLLQARHFNNRDVEEMLENEHSHLNVTLLGRVGTLPRRVTTVSGNMVSFVIGTNEKAGTSWHSILCFLPRMKDYVMENISRGDRVLVEGKLNHFNKKEDEGYFVAAEEVKMVNRSMKNRLDREHSDREHGGM